jgi:uncharacterized protein
MRYGFALAWFLEKSARLTLPLLQGLAGRSHAPSSVPLKGDPDKGFLPTLLVAAALCVTVPAFAQGPNPPGAAGQAAPDPARLAAAKELMIAAGAAKQFDIAVPLIAQQLEGAFVNLKPEHSAVIKDVFKLMPARFSERKNELLDQIAVLYAQRLTIDELNEITKFYKSPIGAKFVQMQPELMQQSMELGEAWGQKIGQEIAEEVRKELKQRGVPI